MSSLNFHNLSFNKLLVCIKIVEVGCCSVVLLWRLVKTAAQSFKSLFFLRFLVCFFQCADKNMSEGDGWQKIENTSLTHPQLSSAFRFQSLSSRRNCNVPVLAIDFFFSVPFSWSFKLQHKLFWASRIPYVLICLPFPFDLCYPAHWYWSLLLILFSLLMHHLCDTAFDFALFCWGQKKPIRCLFSDVSDSQLRCIKGARQVRLHHCVSVEWVHVFLLRGGRVPARTTRRHWF